MNAKDWDKVRKDKERELEKDEELLEKENLEDAFDDEEAKVSDDETLEDEEEESLESLRIKELREQVIRAQAEALNVRKRAEREIQNAHRYGTEKLIKDLLPMMDSLDQALQIAKDNNDQSMVEGLELTVKLFLDIMKKNHITEINPLGQPFNPEEHEAMSVLENKDVKPHTVVEVFQKGYRLYDRVIRPARVIVSK